MAILKRQMVLILFGLAFFTTAFWSFNSPMKIHSIIQVKNKPRIFCIILTSPANLDNRAIQIETSWAHKCDGHKFMTVIPENYIKFNKKLLEKKRSNDSVDFHSAMLPLYEPNGFRSENYNKLTDKVFFSIMDISRNFPDYDWYLKVSYLFLSLLDSAKHSIPAYILYISIYIEIKADDDTMIFVDNLRDFLADKSPMGPYTYGYNFKVIVDKGYHSGGAGYVMPRQALLDLGSRLIANYSSCSNTGTEDVDIARCLRVLGYEPGVSLDEKGRERFHPLNVGYHYIGGFPEWMYKYAANELKTVRLSSAYMIFENLFDLISLRNR